jgi:hypothetical protein
MIYEKATFTNCLIKQINEDQVQEIKNEENNQLHDEYKKNNKMKENVEIQKTEFKNNEIKEEIKENNEELHIIDLDKYISNDTINIKNPLDEYNAIIQKMKESSLQAKQAYMLAKDIKQQYNINDELEMPLI